MEWVLCHGNVVQVGNYVLGLSFLTPGSAFAIMQDYVAGVRPQLQFDRVVVLSVPDGECTRLPFRTLLSRLPTVLLL